MTAPFRPAWWLRGPHRQTVWSSVLRRAPSPRLRRERLTTPDDDFIDVDWTVAERGGGGDDDGGASGAERRPLVVVLHGLEGSSRSNYVRGLLAAVIARGWRGAVLHFRGCGGEPNRRPYGYNAGMTDDLDWFIGRLRRAQPRRPIACVGYSLGGNALLRWLGERGERAALQAAVAVSVPFLIDAGAERMRRGLSRGYQFYLLRSMRASYRRKFAGRDDAPVAAAALAGLRDFRSFDDAVTAPLHGYDGVDDYYRRASCRRYLGGVRVPTLVLHAADDPFMLRRAIPERSELSAQVRLEVSPHGGHVGFVDGPLPWRAGYWLERRIPVFLASFLDRA